MKKLLILFAISLAATSCSSWDTRDKIIVSPEEVINAIEVDNTFLLNTFFAEGFPVIYEDNTGKSLLVKALENDSLEALDMILNRGAYLEKSIENGQSSIFYVRSLEALKKVVTAGADINRKNSNGESVLTYFIKNKPLSYSRYLVESGAELNQPEDRGWTPVFYAVVSNDLELVDIMGIKGGNFTLTDELGNLPLFYTSDENMLLKLLSITKYNLNSTNKKGENILGEVYLKAVANGYTDVIEKLLHLGVNPYYMSYGDSAVSIAVDSRNKNMVEFLRKKGIY